MHRVLCTERPDWQDTASQLGFIFHTMYGDRYWDESRYYAFTLDETEQQIEDVTTDLYQHALYAVDIAVRDEYWLNRLGIPELYWDWIRQSWDQADPALYGRFDLAYTGNGPAKMLEFNADTPTSLYEAGFFQWVWLEQQLQRGALPAGADQFNSIQEKLIAWFAQHFAPGCHIHFAACKGSDEDRATVQYIEDCARQAGMKNHFVYVEDIGIDKDSNFADQNSLVMDTLFKLYPLEDMMQDDFGPALTKSRMQLIEPAWKAILSNKGLLPLMWTLFPDHPNLLPAWFEQDFGRSGYQGDYVRKPLFSREGANIDLFRNGVAPEYGSGEYGKEGHIIQQMTDIAKFDDDYMVIGSWIVGDAAAGISIREDKSLVTKDMSRFVPHIILD